LALKDLLHQNLSSNPLIQKYITNIEKPNPTHGLCVLFSSIIKEILTKISTSEKPFSKYGCGTFHSKFVISGGRPEGSKRNLKFQSGMWHHFKHLQSKDFFFLLPFFHNT
jgi:hypothetical protein